MYSNKQIYWKIHNWQILAWLRKRSVQTLPVRNSSRPHHQHFSSYFCALKQIIKKHKLLLKTVFILLLILKPQDGKIPLSYFGSDYIIGHLQLKPIFSLPIFFFFKLITSKISFMSALLKKWFLFWKKIELIKNRRHFSAKSDFF